MSNRANHKPDTDGQSQRVYLEGTRKQALEMGRNRLLVAGVVFGLAFMTIGARLVNLTLMDRGEISVLAGARTTDTQVAERANIVDRNGVVMATSLPTVSLYADPAEVIDVAEVSEGLATVFPDLNRRALRVKLSAGGRFVWLRRNLTPDQQYRVNRLGLPGLGFRRGERRVFPQGNLASHVLGLTDVDGHGIAGVERYFDATLSGSRAPLKLALDLRVQALVRAELIRSMTEHKALGAAGVVMDADNGEILAMVSLPDFDPNVPSTARGEAGFNRVTKGVYEMGSTFKLFTTAMALDSGTVTLEDGYDASRPIRVASYTISDFHAKNRWLSVPEILLHSSNIGSAKMALDLGREAQKNYLDRMGMLRPAALELPEIGTPLSPGRWRDINTMTISYGHGIAVSPLQVVSGVAAVVNGGVRWPSTLLKLGPDEASIGTQILSPKTSREMRALMRLVVRRGTGRKADVPGYEIGGKTGTADKMVAGGYGSGALISSFVAAFPMSAPRYVVFALMDEPKGTKRTSNYATGGWVAAPLVGRIVRRMGPMLGVVPGTGNDVADLLAASSQGERRAVD